MAELSSGNGDFDSVHSPPPKPIKSSRRHHRGHKYKARKGRAGGVSSGLSSDSIESHSETSQKLKKPDKSKRRRRREQSYKHYGSSMPQLTMADHHRVTKFLRELDNDQLIGVGGALGLYHPNLKRMKDLLGDMASAWLREDDNVTESSGSPSWASLATALEDIGHKGIASKIRKGPMQATQMATPPSPEMSSAFSRYRSYLKSYYDTIPICDDKLSIAPCSEFISLDLVKKDKSVDIDDTFSQSTFYGDRDQISAHKVPLELDGIFTSESKFVLVEGAPGIGKSTLSWELCRKWDTLRSLQHYSIVLLLKLREGRVQNASSLNELFYHRDKTLCESVVSEVLTCEGEGVLLILDGFDEMPAFVVRNKESLIMEIISGTCIHKATRLITSRPSAFHRSNYFSRNLRHVEIEGFSDESKEKFAKITFKSEPIVLEEFKKFVFSNPIIKSLMYIPVNCAILAQSYKDVMRSSKQVPKTTTQLYTMLTRILIRRHLIAIERWDKESKVPDLKDLPEDVKGDLERVSNLAYTGLFKEDVQLVFTDDDVGEGFNLLGVLSEVKEMHVEGARTSYSFLHLSIQEFLAAWHVSCHQELVRDALTMTLHDSSPLHQVFGLVLAGLIDISTMSSYLINWYKRIISVNQDSIGAYKYKTKAILFTCHCLYEAQVEKSSDFFCNFSENIDIHLSTPLDVYVFGYCLANVPSLYSDVCILSSFDMLVSSLADHVPRGNEVSGSIDTLRLQVYSSFSSKLKDLPYSLLNSIRCLIISSESSCALLEGIPVLPCLVNISFGGIFPLRDPKNTDYNILETKKCPNLLSLGVSVELSERNICELTEVIANSFTIERLYLDPLHNFCGNASYGTLVQAALSCPSLRDLTTNFPFVISQKTNPKNLQSLELTYDKYYLTIFELPRLFDCLYNIVKICEASPVQSLSVQSLDSLFDSSSLPLSSLSCDCVGGYYDCISLLNVCLHHHWPSMKRLELDAELFPCTQFHLSSLSHALRRDPDTSQLKLRRSKSLSDLVCLKTLDELVRKHCTAMNPTLNDLRHIPVVKKAESCPDLVGIQSLHPLMERELFKRKNCNSPVSYSDPILSF